MMGELCNLREALIASLLHLDRKFKYKQETTETVLRRSTLFDLRGL